MGAGGGAQPLGRYRFLITARRYRLASRPFRLGPTRRLRAALERAGDRVIVRLSYPAAVPERDFTARPARVAAARAVLRVGGRRLVVGIRADTATVVVPAGTAVTLPADAARDRFGNTNGSAVKLPRR